MGLKFRNVNIELSSICNFDCTYCAQHKITRKKQLIDFELVLKLIDEIKEIGLTDEINFYVMGESLLHNKVIDILRYTKESGIKIKLNTNGALLDGNMRKGLLSLGIDKLYITYHDSYVKYFKYNKIKPSISFEKWHNNIISTVEDKYKYNSKTEVTIILFKIDKALSKVLVDNIKIARDKNEASEALREWIEFGKALSAKYSIPYKFQLKTDNFFVKLISNLFDRVDKTYEITPGYSINLIKAHTFGNNLVSGRLKNKKIKKAIIGSCEALRNTMAILADGSYTLCCGDWNGNVVVGNANNESLKSLLSSEKAKKIIDAFSKGRLPFEYCKICRGGYTYKTWLFNQFHSCLLYNSNIYRRLRRISPVEAA